MYKRQSMARVFDPGTNIQASVSGNLFNFLFILYFFSTGCHREVIRAIVASFSMVPVGTVSFSGDVGSFLAAVFVSAFALVLKLILPFIAVEFVLEMSMGVLMKLIPQIHIFTINFQFKILLAVFTLLVFSQPIGEFIDSYLLAMMQSMEKVLMLLGS